MSGLIKFELFKEMPWKWALWWVLLPNLAIVAMWPVGGPSMATPMFLCGIFAMIAAQQPHRMIRMGAMLGIFLTVLAVYVTKSFNIGLKNIIHVDQYVGELSPAQSPEYVAAGVILLISMGLALHFGSRTHKFVSRQQYVMAFAAVALLVNVDTLATEGTRGSYKAVAPAGTPIDSAILQNGINPQSIAAKNLIVIIVESWGVPNNDFDKRIDRAVWDTSPLQQRYTASRGISEYYGSTTNAEVREMCGVWADHNSFDFDNSHCLPERFKEAGFSATAYHSFNSEFFSRWEWYPKLGFESSHFEESLRADGADFCDGVFAGACDVDVPAVFGKDLKNSKSERNFVYWLTLNAHLPVASDEVLGTDECALGDAGWRGNYPMLCRSYRVHELVADSIFEEIMKEDFPESDILIVGDHMPPFFPRAIRSRFDAAHVPWIYLQNREALERKAAASSQHAP